TNEVGQPHTFTVTVQKDAGDGAGFVAATVGNVDVTLTNSNGATNTLNAAASTCDDAQPSGDNLDANGQCTVVFTSNSAGQVTGHASVSLTLGGLTLTRSTNGVSPNSGDAVKTFVDARISITPNGTNFIYESHTFTVHVQRNTGLGAGFVDAAGEHPTVTLTNTLGATATITANACTSTGTDASGNCTVTVSSPTTGTTTAHAAVDVVIGTVTVHRETNGANPPGNSGDATKLWKSAQVTLTKTFESGPFTHPPFASPGVCFTLARNTYTGQASPAPPVSTDSLQQCKTAAPFTFTWHNLVEGTYTITETTTPPGYATITPKTFTVLPNDFSDGNLSQSLSANDPLRPGSFLIRKTISGSTSLGTNSFQFRVQPCGADSTCATPGTQITGSPFTVDNTHNPITISGLSEGYYLVTELPNGSFTPDTPTQIAKVVAGDVGGPVTLTFNNKPAAFSQLVPTQTTCSQFNTGTAGIENAVTYGVKSNKVNNVAPGVLFYYTKVFATGTTLDFDMVQTQAAGSPFPLFGIQSISVFNSACGTLSSGVTITQPSAGIVHVRITGTTAGTAYLANIKIDDGTIVGAPVTKSGGVYPTVGFTYATWVPNKATGVNVSSADGTIKPK
ncbi:MAG: SpaA isopeptide-forming pilin-related protein, partial [Actinomycetota bacterium]